MAGLGIKHFNWLRTPTALESAQAWRARQQTAREDLEANNSAAWSVLTSASIDLANGMSSIAASTAVKRLQDAAKAQNAKLVDTLA